MSTRHTERIWLWLALITLLCCLLLSACGAGTAAPIGNAADAAPSGDLLDAVRQRGVLLVSTDANYKPQSLRNAAGTFEGFDVVAAGGWNGGWDINVAR